MMIFHGYYPGIVCFIIRNSSSSKTMYANNEMNPLHNGDGFESKKLKEQLPEKLPGITNYIAKRIQEDTVTKSLKELTLERRRLLDVLRSLNRK